MKRFGFVIIFICFCLQGFTQIKFKAASAVGGATLNRGGTFEYVIYGNGNGNSSTKQLLFDVQYDLANFELVSVAHTGTGGNGGILPQNSSPNLSYYDYNGYSFTQVTSGTSANNTTNGTTNYQRASYSYNQNMTSSILRVTLTWSTNAAMPYSSYSDFIKITLRLKNTSTAYSFNPIKLNFVAGWTGAGQYDATLMETPLSTTVNMNQNFGKYVTANVDVNSNLYNLSALKAIFYDTAAKTSQLFNVTSTGAVDINQSLLSANKVYDVSLAYESLKTLSIYNSAITISDFTTAQSEFTSMGLDGTNGQTLKTGQSLYAADLNENKKIDGGDLPRLLGQVVGLDTIQKIPNGANSNTWTSLPTWRATDAYTIAGNAEWCIVNPNSYSQGVSRIYIDMRKFSGTGVSPNQIKSIQLFDVYTGPIEYMSEDGSWAFYKVPSSMSKVTDGTSLYTTNIRNVNNTNTDYALQAEFEFNINPNNSWSAINTSNWSTITAPHAYFKTGTLGTNAILDLKYLLWNDVNRSHSSQVVLSSNGASSIQTNAVSSLQTNTAFKEMADNIKASGGWINTPYDISSIEVNLNNSTVTSNVVEIPVSINTKGVGLSGLQFEFTFDETKLKFEELSANLPNGWYIFSSSKGGKVKFGALDQNKVSPITGSSVPFKLKFSTIGDGVDILTSIKVSPVMDASDAKGNQIGIDLNTTQIKLTGYNHF